MVAVIECFVHKRQDNASKVRFPNFQEQVGQYDAEPWKCKQRRDDPDEESDLGETTI